MMIAMQGPQPHYFYTAADSFAEATPGRFAGGLSRRPKMSQDR